MIKKLLLVLLCLYITGCSLRSVQQDTAITIPWEEHKKNIAQYSNWELIGKINIAAPNENQTASLKWVQFNDSYQIDIHGPWGQGGASIKGAPEKVIINVSGDKQYISSDPEKTLYEQLGWDIPLNDIYWWLRGIPAPTSPSTYHLENNRLKTLQQRGWNIEYTRYNNLTPALPNKLYLSRQNIKITIIIKSWIKL